MRGEHATGGKSDATNLQEEEIDTNESSNAVRNT